MVDSQTLAKKKIWATVSICMEKFDADGNGFLDRTECRPLLQGLLTGLGKEYDEETLDNYYSNDKFCKSELGIDNEGLFKMICDLNGLEVSDDMFEESEASQPNRWDPTVHKLDQMDCEAISMPTMVWPEQGVVDSWPSEKQIRLQKIYYAKVAGEPEAPLMGIQL